MASWSNWSSTSGSGGPGPGTREYRRGQSGTTAALGPTLRAAGQEQRIDIVQFMKGWQRYGEIEGVDRLPTVAVHPLELILTGWHAHSELIDRAHLVVEMRKVTLPFARSIDGRRDIEL